MSVIGSSATISGVPAPASSAPSLSAIGTAIHTNSCLILPHLTFGKRNVHDPRALAVILEKAEEELARKRHPDPYTRTSPSPSLLAHPQLTYNSDLQQIQHSLVARNGASVFFPDLMRATLLTPFTFRFFWPVDIQGTQSTCTY